MNAEPLVPELQYPVPRRYPRFKINVPIRAITHRDKTRIVDGRGNELNEGGMAIFAGLEMKVGDELEVEFTPPYQDRPIRVRSTVRDRRGYYYGVEFQRATPEDEKQIALIRAALQAVGSPIVRAGEPQAASQ
ncbi:MAG: PilZ domain-containing protein [Terriglobales bacterium]